LEIEVIGVEKKLFVLISRAASGIYGGINYTVCRLEDRRWAFVLDDSYLIS
jgi:hypothetical protein